MWSYCLLYTSGGGIQQAMDYAQILDLKFAYSSNGDAFLEHDFITGKETEIKLENFPTEEELYNRYLASKNYTSDELNIIETPFYYCLLYTSIRIPVKAVSRTFLILRQCPEVT